MLALVAALAATGLLVAQTPEGARRPPPPPPAAATVWPQAKRADVPGTLADGVPYNPAYFLDEQSSAGTAVDPDGEAVRLVLRAADGTMRVLRRLPTAVGPRFTAFTRVGDRLVGAEQVTGRDGIARTTLWRADLSGGAPRKITDDTGWMTFAGSDSDLVVNAGRLYWTALASGNQQSTEVRSVPVEGGPVQVRTEPGEWTLAGWPWLVSPSSRSRAELRNLDTGRVIDVDAARDRLSQCGSSWCRVYVLSADGPARTDLMRPDGSERLRVADDGATASIVDVVPLDRFEVLAKDSSALGAAIGGQELLVYDLETRRSILVAEAATSVSYRAGVLWWSTNALGRLSWHTLDLRTV
ncbi:hypothetical protein Ais01nite_64680 [Asanoa ishikariensis]|uniref:WD40-like Beta Propeller Repeat n=1 Tax=Asanoa ishikariensis TaxID=137265 RepID=A0A1H3NRF5_9ACTN|nr:hypothetical protein Ais01nite_64680 [Asanoa ishikariensis]SDY91260.1 hypothetical protein SAMN05421684_2255 [Asanoa ishikariensis]